MLGVIVLVVSIAVTMGNSPPATPTITEPHQNGLVLNHEDVHMETAPFSDPDPGDTHAASDWEIWTVTPQERVWAALGKTGPERVHIHLGDGVFQASHAGRSSLLPSVSYRLRVRHKDSSGQAATEWSQYAERTFSTGPLSSVFPMELVDVAATPAPQWRDLASVPVSLPGGGTPASLRLESGAAAALLVIAGGSGGQNVVTNPPALPQHEAVRVRLAAGGGPLVLPETDLEFTDSTGVDRVVFLPSVGLAAGQSAYYWVSTNGSTFVGQASQPQPDFSLLARGAALPWEVNQAGFRVELVATGFQLPVNVAVVPNPGPGPTAPLMYITELYGAIKVVRRDGTVGTYASGLLNFNPTGSFPGSGEQGVTGILVEPASGDIFATLLYDASPPSGPHYPKVVRFHSNDGGQTAATQTTVLDMVGESQGQSHQISNISIGPDGRLYVHMGDGFNALTAQNLDSFRGKILRMSLAGAALSDNPFYNAANGINARDYVYAYGFRNPFGGSWRAADGKHYEIENGPMVDRFAVVNRGQNYLWDGSDASMRNFAIYNWEPPVAPVNIAFVQTQTFGGSQFPPGKMGHVFATLSGPTWATGPQPGVKRIVEMVLDAAGNLVSGPTPLITYNGSGKATCVGLAAGPDGLYFTDLYKDEGYSQPTDPGANLLRVRYVGAADFSADVTSGPAPLEVHFTDLSTVPSPSAWLWSFGDGSTGTQQNPTHTYAQDGVYTVRLSVTGPGGAVVKQRNAYIRVGQFPSVAFIGGALPLSPADQAVASRLVGAGFVVEAFDDEPANRPSAQALAAAFDLVVISSTVSSLNIGGEFRTANLPMVFWERALLQIDREALSDLGTTFGPATGIDILPVSHPITAGLSPGAMPVFSSGQTMSLAVGQIPPGAVVLARRSGSPDAALVAADTGAALLGGYTAPARRVFFFLEDAGFLAATPGGAQLLDRAVCWAGGFTAVITADPLPVTVAPGQVATFETSAAGAAPLSYRWRRNGVNLTDNGRITGSATRTLRIDPVQAGDAGGYDVVVSNGCGQDTSAAAALTVASCYANCDGSTVPPILSVSDFICFQTKFAAGDPYANCDGSTVEPVLNVNDFVCFQTRYAAGCP